MNAWPPRRTTCKRLGGLTTTLVGLGTLMALCALAAEAQTADEGAAPSLNPLKTLDKGKLKGFVEQPLFDPARRLPPIVAAPIAVEAPPPVRAPDPPPTLHLLGIIHGKQNVAIVHRDDDPKTVLLYSGDQVGPWTVKVLPTNGLRLINGDRTFDYALFGSSSATPRDSMTQMGELPTLAQTMSARNARLQRRTY